MRRLRAIALFIALVFSLGPAFGQNGSRSELSIDFTGDFQKQVTGLSVTDSATYSGGGLADYRYHFSDWSAIELNYSYTRFTQNYSYTSGNAITQANAQEFTLAYVSTLGKPASARIRPFVEAGTGGIVFSQVTAGSTFSGLTQDRAVFLFGAGADWHLTSLLSLRAGYRGLLYQAPDFSVPQAVTHRATILSEPYVGVVFRF